MARQLCGRSRSRLGYRSCFAMRLASPASSLQLCLSPAAQFAAGRAGPTVDGSAGEPGHDARAFAANASPDPDLSGLRLMPGGGFALDTRLQLARRAERSLDLQYYQIENDETGRYLLRALRDARRRGVRVRLLMDDLYTSGEDELLLGLAATRTSSCGCSTRSRGARQPEDRVLPRRCSTSSASTGACTTSCSSPTAPWRWPADATSATSTSGARRARISSTSTPSSPARWCRASASCSTSTGTAATWCRSRRS